MNRRTFLKLASMGSMAVAVGCSSKSDNNLFTMVQATEDMVTGKAAWYASTCRECPAGCGVLAKNREGRVVKLEGNPLHPVNRGALCMRGQAALQGLYNPDRLTQPRLKTASGWQTITFTEARERIAQQIQRAADRGSDRIALLTETVGQTQLDLFTTLMAHYGGQTPLIFEPLAHEALKHAWQQLTGTAMLPGLHMERADLILGFGADFLETWLSPVQYARQFKQMHGLQDGKKGRFVQVSPFQNLTGANADRWIACRPDTQVAVIMGMIRRLVNDGHGKTISADLRKVLVDISWSHTPEAVEIISGVSLAQQENIYMRLTAARRPLVLGVGCEGSGRHAAAAELAALFLNLSLDPKLTLFDVDHRHRVEIAASRRQVVQALEAMDDPKVELALLNNVNPVYALPDGQRIGALLADPKRFVVAFSPFMDETAATADLVVPVQMPLETWDAYESTSATLATQQPTLGRITKAPSLGDLILHLLPADQRPATNYQTLVAQTVLADESSSNTKAYLQTIQQGGRFGAPKATASRPSINLAAGVSLKRQMKALPEPPTRPVLLAPPSIRFFDGRGANRPWLVETPDTLTQIAWQTTALIHPESMAAADLTDGDEVVLKSRHGKIRLPAYAYAGLFPDTVVVSAGQGHNRYGRWASDQGINPNDVLGRATSKTSGAPAFSTVLEPLIATGQQVKLASTSGSRVALDRKIAPTIALAKIGQHDDHKPGLTMDSFPLTPPTPEGYDPKRDLYPPHDHADYRWAMVVDMDRCIGCTACVAACYAENNIGMVGEERIAQGREMAWLQIQRYHDPEDMARITFLPMMCQHCDNAPCEAVCPVYAPHHSKEGLNNQIYNRCIGTRFCAQNCPYKVRRFNWFDWQWPKPLNMQLNPEVTVRSKGVMEKCSFCVQRIKAGHNTAKNEKRAIRDGEVTPACAQTCPTGALIFGSLMDPASRVSRLIKDPRAYQVMGYLNTKPAVIYLKKVVQEI